MQSLYVTGFRKAVLAKIFSSRFPPIPGTKFHSYLSKFRRESAGQVTQKKRRLQCSAKMSSQSNG